MAAYATPGVYFETIDVAPRVVAPVRTDIAGFVGLAERGPIHEPTRLTSWKQFEGRFGGFVGNAYLPYAVKAFFDNGGATCYAVRVVGPGYRHATLAVPSRRPVADTTLAVAAPVLGTSLEVPAAGADLVRPGDAVVVAGRLRREHAVVASVAPAGAPGNVAIELDRSLQRSYPAGSRVLVAPAALAIAATSPGRWGNRLLITLARAAGGSTMTDGEQPADGSASMAGSVAGFEAGHPADPSRPHDLVGGSLVRISQGSTEALRRVRAIVPSLGRAGFVLTWDEPLPSGLFDLGAPLHLETVEVTLEVALGNRRERYVGLSTVYGHSRYVEHVVNPASGLIRVHDLVRDPAVNWLEVKRPRRGRRWTPEDLPPPRFPVLEPPAAGARRRDDRPMVEDPFAIGRPAFSARPSDGFDDLASLAVADFIDVPIDDPDAPRGLRALEDTDDVAIVAMPDAVLQPLPPPPRPLVPPPDVDPCAPRAPDVPDAPPAALEDAPPGFSTEEIDALQRALIGHCERLGYRVAVLDPPRPLVDVEDIQNWRTRLESERGFAALYYPWVTVYDPIRAAGALVREVPPSGHVAGVYARIDLDPAAGVHKAPANAALEWTTDVVSLVDDVAHGLLNEQGINVIRPYPGRGIRVFGARTISVDPAWRYVSVRRLLSMIEKAVWLASQWAVFEPNTFLTRETLRLSLSAFLLSLWRRGALAGAVPEDAFFVKSDDENNPEEIVAAGRLIVDIGVAPAIPAEFVVFRLGRIENQLVVME